MATNKTPTWVQRNSDVSALYDTDSSFAESCRAAKTAKDRKALAGEAERVMNHRLNRKS